MRGDNPHLRPVDMVRRIAKLAGLPCDTVSVEVTLEAGHVQFQATVAGMPFVFRGEPASTPTQALDNLLTMLREDKLAAVIREELGCG